MFQNLNFHPFISFVVLRAKRWLNGCTSQLSLGLPKLSLRRIVQKHCQLSVLNTRSSVSFAHKRAAVELMSKAMDGCTWRLRCSSRLAVCVTCNSCMAELECGNALTDKAVCPLAKEKRYLLSHRVIWIYATPSVPLLPQVLALAMQSFSVMRQALASLVLRGPKAAPKKASGGGKSKDSGALKKKKVVKKAVVKESSMPPT
jgi:hypothetical protein